MVWPHFTFTHPIYHFVFLICNQGEHIEIAPVQSDESMGESDEEQLTRGGMMPEEKSDEQTGEE